MALHSNLLFETQGKAEQFYGLNHFFICSFMKEICIKCLLFVVCYCVKGNRYCFSLKTTTQISLVIRERQIITTTSNGNNWKRRQKGILKEENSRKMKKQCKGPEVGAAWNGSR